MGPQLFPRDLTYGPLFVSEPVAVFSWYVRKTSALGAHTKAPYDQLWTGSLKS